MAVRNQVNQPRTNTSTHTHKTNLATQSEEGSSGFPECGDSIDPTTFEQILEMDDDEEEREFSKSIVYGFFEQAEATFDKMEKDM